MHIYAINNGNSWLAMSLILIKNEVKMKKIIVIYPLPKSIEKFEQLYLSEHIDLATKIPHYTKIETTKFDVDLQLDKLQFYRMAEIYFNDEKNFEIALNSIEAKKAIEHANKISSGGKPFVQIGNIDK